MLQPHPFSALKTIEYAFQKPGLNAPEKVSRCHQVHEALVVSADQQTDEQLAQTKADALFASTARTLAIQTADCLPVLMCSQDGKFVAAVHAGWRGLNKGILVEALKTFQSRQVEPSTILVAIGPAIGACCFEVGAEVAGEFKKIWGSLLKEESRFFRRDPAKSENPGRQAKPTTPKSVWLDLKAIATRQLTSHGVPAGNLQDLGICTYCSALGFESYRRATHEGRKAGRQWSWIKKL
ncbi:MAG: peptidoglycan editing factor PgeF [Bdellovibrionota bacterium]